MMTKPRDPTYYFNRMAGAWVIPDDWQMKLKKGDYYEIESECAPTIYGEILESFREMGFYRVQAYSTRCLGGEKGKLLIVVPTRPLTRQEFEEARARHWKTVEGEVQ
jgi:hypothetical protein